MTMNLLIYNLNACDDSLVNQASFSGPVKTKCLTNTGEQEQWKYMVYGWELQIVLHPIDNNF
jgi:hypothetical protein